MSYQTSFSRACLALSLLASAGTLVSCASPENRATQQQRATQNIEDPIRALEARAELEAINPLKPVDESIVRQVVQDDAPALVPGTAEYKRAMLDASTIETQQLFWAPPEPAQIDPINQAHALKLYTRARMLRQQGQGQDAARVLERATELDPSSPKLARTLGEVKAAAGDSVGAIQAYELAIELGDRSPSTLVALASNASTLGDQEQVIALCTLALEQPENEEPIARTLAGILLGNAQIREGYLRSGAESLETALNNFNPNARDPRWRQELVQIMGRRPALWVVVGDAWSRIGMHARAARAYDAAAALSNGDAPGLTSRRIAQLLRDGRPASGALVLIEHLRARSGDPSWQEGEWVQTLSTIPEIHDALHDSIGALRRNGEQTPSARRALMALEIRGLSPEEALARLGDAGQDARVPEAISLILRAMIDDDRTNQWALKLVHANPSSARAVADAMLMLPRRPESRLITLDPRDPDAQLFASSLALRMGRADLFPAFGSLPVDSLSDQSNPWLESMTQVLAKAGRWDLARSVLAELERRSAAGDRDATQRLAASLMLMQSPEAALQVATSLGANDDATPDEMVLLSRIASATNDPELAYDALDHAFMLDPSDTSIAERLMRLVGQGGPLEDEDLLRDIVRTIGQNTPRSELFALLRASDLARNGLLREAESLILEINEHREGDIVGDDLLLSVWKTRQTQGDEEALRQGIDWLGTRLNRSPGAVRTALALAQIWFELEDFERAERVLSESWQQTGAFEVARVRESLVRDSLGDPERARSLAADRLRGVGGIDASIEYAQVLASSGDAGDAITAAGLLESAIPSGITLLSGQQQQLTQVVVAMGEHAETEGIDTEMLRIVDLIEDRTGPLDFFMARTKLLLVARQPGVDLDELIALIEQHASRFTDRQQVQTLRTLPAQVLLGDDRSHEAVALVSRMAVRGDSVDSEMLIETFRLLGAAGENSDLLGVLDTLEQAGAMRETIEITTKRLGTPERPIDGLDSDQQRADLAYTAGALAAAFEREGQSEAFMRLALSFDPEHGWSNNDLGYMLVERGQDIDEAEQMLETAARVFPDQASVIDSLGWLRYKQGIYQDERDPQTGERLREGAITLLTRANRLDTQRSNATILLHLGDALWRAGMRDQAIEAWVGGENMLRARIRVLSAQPDANRGAIQSLSEELRLLRYRVQDAESGATPNIAPILSEDASAG